VAGYQPRWFTRLQTFTHRSANRVRSSVTLLIETNTLPLSQAANPMDCYCMCTCVSVCNVGVSWLTASADQVVSGMRITKQDIYFISNGGPEPHSEMKNSHGGVVLHLENSQSITYLLQIQKWLYHVYALCSAFVLIHHPLDSVHFATSQLNGSCSAVIILRVFYTNFYFLVPFGRLRWLPVSHLAYVIKKIRNTKNM